MKRLDECISQLERALWFSSKGYEVFPVHYIIKNGECSCLNKSCGKKGKHPMTTFGFKFLDIIGIV